MKLKLQIEPIPISSHGSNVRTKVKKSDWDIIRKAVYAKEEMYCHICKELCPHGYMDAHEVWKFNRRTHVQKLMDIIGVCKACHGVIHFGRAQKLGYEKEAMRQWWKVNGDQLLGVRMEFNNALLEAQNKHFDLNKIKDWKLDLSFIEEQGFVVNKEEVNKG